MCWVSPATLGYTKEVLGPTRILETKTLSIEAARQMGCPVDDKNYFDDGEIIGVRFAPFQDSLRLMLHLYSTMAHVCARGMVPSKLCSRKVTVRLFQRLSTQNGF